MPSLKGILKTVGPRLAGVIASGIAGWIFTKTKGVVQIDPTTLVEVGTTMIAGYALTHRGVSSAVNPGDAAKSRVADAIKDAASEEGPNEVVIPPSQS